jgi:glycosyltransferase involved in cell wall biosynthesis
MDRKKILILASRWPYPPVAGGKLFFLNVAKALAPQHHLTLLSLCNNQQEMEDTPFDGLFSEIHKVFLPRWRSVWNVVGALPTRTPLQLAYYQSGEFRAKTTELMSSHDAVLAHLIRTGRYLEEAKRIPSALLMADAISLAYQRMTKLSGSSTLWHFLYRAELKRVFNYERESPRFFDQTWLHSDVDRLFLGLDSTKTRIVPIGVDLEEFPYRPPLDSGDVVAFIGNMSFSLNLDACHHFLRDIYPKLQSEKHIRFRVIGACPPAVKQELEKYSGVEVTGRVERIVDAVEGVFCGVCPVRAGAGIQNKVLNYLALGIPCVTSNVGLEGLTAVAGSDLLVYRDPSDAAKKILQLSSDPQLRKKLAENGRRFVEQAHDWKAIHQLVRQNVSELLGEPESKTGSPS